MKAKFICLIFCLAVFGLVALELPLTSVPQINVNITGLVRYPGQYSMKSTDRLSNILEESMHDPKLANIDELSEAEELQRSMNPIPSLRHTIKEDIDFAKHQSHRHVLLKRGQSEEIYDLMRYYRLGEIEQNPILKDGDVVHIGVIEHFVMIEGAVGLSGYVEYCEGDTFEDILRLSYGFLPDANRGTMFISRHFDEQNCEHFELNLEENAKLLFTPLIPKDHIIIPFDNECPQKKAVFLSGKLKNVGKFLVDKDSTIWDIIQMAGGVMENADLANAVIFNRNFSEEPSGELERIKMFGPMDMSPIDHAFLRAQMRQSKGLYSVDFEKIVASEGREGDRILNHYDHIFIPDKLNVVWVSGQVKKPGLVEYEAGKNWKYYVSQANGFTKNNVYRRVRILSASGGNWVKARKDIEIKPGDMIFVPDKIDRYFWTDIKDAVTILASTITILIGVQNLSRR